MTKPTNPTPAPAPEAAQLAEIWASLADARARKGVLDQERAETQEALCAADEAVQAAGVYMATRAADAAAVEAFHEAIRRQVELQARLTAFDEHVLPAALSELERLEGAAEGARLGAAQEELRKREADQRSAFGFA